MKGGGRGSMPVGGEGYKIRGGGGLANAKIQGVMPEEILRDS